MKRNSQENSNGFMAIEWVVGATLLIVPTFILVMSLLQYPPRKSLAQVAASEAAKAFVQEDNPDSALQAANAVAKSVIDDDLGAGSFTPTVDNVKVSPPLSNATAFCPGQEIKITITLPMPILSNPFSENDDPIVSVTEIKSSATERIDDYREIDNASCP